MREHAGRRYEAAIDEAWFVSLAQGSRNGSRVFRTVEPEGDAVIFRQVAAKPDDLADPLAQTCDAVIDAAGDHDQSAGPDAVDRLGDPHLVLPTMPAAKHQSAIEVQAFGNGSRIVTSGLQLEVIRPESLDEGERRGETLGQAKTRFGTNEDERAAFGHRDGAARERMKQRLLGVTAHRQGSSPD